MCGIVGYTGNKECISVLTSGLKMLEYRGYDSAGVAFFENMSIQTVKACGKLTNLEAKLEEKGGIDSNCGMGHTRWATHGAPSDTNSHPHSTETVSLIHNGIIENHREIAAMLLKNGYSFISDTDTERACKLIDMLYKKHANPLKALFEAAKMLKGSYAFGVMFVDIPGKIFALRQDSPLILATDESGAYLASDIPAVLPYTKQYCRLEEGIAAVLSTDGIEFYDKELRPTTQKFETASWNLEEAQKGGFPHFMIKEIHEEPSALKKTVEMRVRDGIPSFDDDAFICDSDLARIKRIHIVACGTAMHAGLVGKYIVEKLAKVPVSVEIASEFRYRDPILCKDDLVLLLSQSGETADTLAALRHAKAKGITTLAIVNVFGSSLAREADYVLYTQAGPEIAVASTKAYSVQSVVMYLLAIKLALINQKIDTDTSAQLCSLLRDSLPHHVEEALKQSNKIKELAQKLVDAEHVFYIGRGIDYHLCVEASLKLKEISYIHSEAYAAGELKHGTISLITDGVPVICIMTEKAVAKKTASGIHEVLSRGANIISICTDETKNECSELLDEDKIILPACNDFLNPFLTATSVQLLAYHVSALKGLDVDKPRNLAKSVTVE